MEEFKSPSKQDVVKAFQSDRLLRNGLILVIVSTLFFALAGAVVGWFLGAVAPDYYRVSLNLEPIQASPAQVGFGLGLTQGATMGFIGGCIVVLSTAWYKSRMMKAVTSTMDQQESS